MHAVAANDLLYDAGRVPFRHRKIQVVIRSDANSLRYSTDLLDSRSTNHRGTHGDEASPAKKFREDVSLGQLTEFVKLIVVPLTAIGVKAHGASVNQTDLRRIRQRHLQSQLPGQPDVVLVQKRQPFSPRLAHRQLARLA